MSPIAAVADRDPSAEPAQPADGAHQATLERVFGRIFAVFLALMMVVFWSSSATLAGNRPGGLAADVLLSALLAAQDAALAAEKAEWRAANAVHDDVLSVLRAVGATGQPPPPWEALRNVVVHAGVDRAMITARRSRSGRVTVTVADHGTGFDPPWKTRGG